MKYAQYVEIAVRICGEAEEQGYITALFSVEVKFARDIEIQNMYKIYFKRHSEGK